MRPDWKRVGPRRVGDPRDPSISRKILWDTLGIPQATLLKRHSHNFVRGSRVKRQLQYGIQAGDHDQDYVRKL